MFNISHEGNSNQNHYKIHFIPTRVAIIKTTENNKWLAEGVKKLKPSYPFGGDYKMTQLTTWKTVW